MVDLCLFTDWKICASCNRSITDHPRRGSLQCPVAPSKLKLLTCADCGCVAYHDTDCQRAHWKSVHKRQCKGLARTVLPLKELMRWHKMQKRMKRENNDAVWCWWEPDNENGITQHTLSTSDNIWRESASRWDGGEIIKAMSGFQHALEPYRLAWPHIGKSSGTHERRGGGSLPKFLGRSLTLARKLLFCAYCELDAELREAARGRLVQ